MARQLNGAETLMGFLSWITLFDPPVVFGATCNASDAVALYEEFATKYDIGDMGADWPDCLEVARREGDAQC